MATSIETHELEIISIGDQPVSIEEFNNVRDAVCLLKWRSKDTSQEWSATGFYANVKLKNEGQTLDFDCVMTNYDNIFLQMEDDSDVVAVFHNENAEKETFEIPLAPFRLIRSHRTEEFNYALIYIDKSKINIQAKGVKPIMADSSELPVIKPNDDVYMIHHPGQMKKHYSQDNVKLVIEPFIEYLAGTLEGPPGSPVFVLKESKFLLVAMHRKNALLVSKILDGIDVEDAHGLVKLSSLTILRQERSMSSISKRRYGFAAISTRKEFFDSRRERERSEVQDTTTPPKEQSMSSFGHRHVAADSLPMDELYHSPRESFIFQESGAKLFYVQ